MALGTLACSVSRLHATLATTPVVRPASDPDTLRSLMAGYQRGDAACFDRLYAALAPPLRRYLLAQTRDAAQADDLLQETFLRLHRARHTYDPALPLEPWAYAIARHVFLMARRSAARRREDPLPEETPAPAAFASAVEARHELERALAGLSPERRGAVLLHHYHGLGFEEIGARLGVRAAAVRLRASRGMRVLRALLRGRP
jgi:RNA polymerase sigma-70 factor (ECF subfamily)